MVSFKFIVVCVSLLKYKIDVERIEKKFQPKDKSKEEIDKKINYELDTLYTFSPLLKGVDHISLIEDVTKTRRNT